MNSLYIIYIFLLFVYAQICLSSIRYNIYSKIYYKLSEFIKVKEQYRVYINMLIIIGISFTLGTFVLYRENIFEIYKFRYEDLYIILLLIIFICYKYIDIKDKCNYDIKLYMLEVVLYLILAYSEEILFRILPMSIFYKLEQPLVAIVFGILFCIYHMCSDIAEQKNKIQFVYSFIDRILFHTILYMILVYSKDIILIVVIHYLYNINNLGG